MIPRYIIVHTAAYLGQADIEEVRRWHLARGFRDVGYHYYFRRDGKVQKGREDTERGAHCVDMGMNGKSLGVCFEGHGDYELFTREQIEGFVDVYLRIKQRWEIYPDKVLGHRETGAEKTCPGKRIDMDYIRQRLREGISGIGYVRPITG